MGTRGSGLEVAQAKCKNLVLIGKAREFCAVDDNAVDVRHIAIISDLLMQFLTVELHSRIVLI